MILLLYVVTVIIFGTAFKYFNYQAKSVSKRTNAFTGKLKSLKFHVANLHGRTEI